MALPTQLSYPSALLCPYNGAVGTSVQIAAPEGEQPRQRSDPFEAITGRVNAPDTDLASRIDELLYCGQRV